MRLINVESMKMEEFFNEAVPPYAILSHRWGSEEVSLQEWNRREEIEASMQRIAANDGMRAGRHEQSEHDCYRRILCDQYRELGEQKMAIEQKAGYAKIQSFVRLARDEKYRENEEYPSYRYVWIDTCCMDKTNNVELSEAINSMFAGIWMRRYATSTCQMSLKG